MRVCVCVGEREGERERVHCHHTVRGEGGAYMYLGQVHAQDYCTLKAHETPKERQTSIEMLYDLTSYGHTLYGRPLQYRVSGC